jgi:hypothetical protein
MQKTILILALSLVVASAFGQKYLQLERLHNPKTRKYFPGDEITFRLNNGLWYTRVIDDISYEGQIVLFANGHVAVDSIMAFRSYKSGRWSRSIGNQLFNFAAAWVLFSLVDEAVSDDPFQNIPKSSVMVPATSVATGFLIKKLFKHRTFRIKRNRDEEVKKWRLRAMDLTVK